MALQMENPPGVKMAPCAVDDKEAERTAVNIDPPAGRRRRPEDEDDRLLQRVAENDELAFRQLVERHVDRAYGLALRILRNPTDAEDVSQEVMVKIWTHRGSWQAGNAKFSTWLYRVVTNRCIDLHRRPRTEGIEKAPEQTDKGPDALVSMQRNEVASMLDSAMSRLPDQQRIALILSYTDGLKNSEIAEIMETTVMAVESLLKRGRQKLRQHLQGSEEDIRESFTSY